MKIKQISREQYIALAQLKMPVYSSPHKYEEESVGWYLLNEWIQKHEHSSWDLAEKCSHFYTLVDSDDEA